MPNPVWKKGRPEPAPMGNEHREKLKGPSYKVGDAVEVWSHSRNVWFVGEVEEIGAQSGSQDCVRVRFGKSLEKWIVPKEFRTVLRRHVSRFFLSDPSAPPTCVLQLARKRYYKKKSSSLMDSSWLLGSEGTGQQQVTVEQLEKLWIQACQQVGEVSADENGRQDKVRIRQQLDKSLSACGRKQNAPMTVDEWIHESLLLVYPPGQLVKEAIEKKLAAQRKSTLSHMVSLWMKMDKDVNGRILVAELEEALRAAGHWSAAAENIAREIAYDLDGDGFASVAYCDWVAAYLGISFSEVCLAWYDLTGGWSPYISPLLLWHQEGGIWHTSLMVYGSEFYYSGSILRGRPGASVFGLPTKIQRLGLTTIPRLQFLRHLDKEWRSQFKEVNYDILEWNCNNFTDVAAVYLLGQQIPEEIRLQPERTMNAPMVRALRPLFNRWLGRVEADADVLNSIDASKMPPLAASEINKVRLAQLTLGDDLIVLHMPADAPQPLLAQIQKRYRDGSCDIVYLNDSEEEKEAYRVPASKLKSSFDEYNKEGRSCIIS